MKRLLLIFLMVICFASHDAIAQLQWREVTRKVVGRSLVDPSVSDGVEIFGKDGVITIRTQRRVQVRVLTILGQSVSQATLQPGTSELRIGSHGVFLVKADNVTVKVAL